MGVPTDLLMRVAQGQGFVGGSGCVFFLGVDWERLESLGSSAELRYRDALVSIGAVGHALVAAATSVGLGTRMTPAIHETTASEIFHLPSNSEMLYLLKVARRAA
ncbi:nitroreductase family protein [Thalassiella azotivora]